MVASWDGDRKVTNDHVVAYVDPDDPSTPQAARDALRVIPLKRNVVRLLANAPVFAPACMQLVNACFAPNKAVRPSDWQLAVLLTSRILDAPYEWDVNWPLANKLPHFQPDHVYEPLLAKRDLSDKSLFSDRQRLIGRFCEEIHGPKNRVSEKTMMAMKPDFSDEEIMELFIITGLYGMLARMMVSTKIDFDEPIQGLDEIIKETFAHDIRRDGSFKSATE